MSDNIYSADMVGILCPIPYAKERYKDDVRVNTISELQILIKVISDIQTSAPNEELLTCYPSRDLEPLGFVDPLGDKFTREQAVRDWLKDRLLIFRMQRKWKDNKNHYNVSNVRYAPKPDDLTDDTHFKPIPIFKKNSERLHNFDTLVQKLWGDQHVGFVEGISTEDQDTPRYVLWYEEDLDTHVLVGPFVSHRIAHGGFRFIFDELKVSVFDPAWEDSCVRHGKTDIMFVPDSIYAQMDAQMKNIAPMHNNDSPDLLAILQQYEDGEPVSNRIDPPHAPSASAKVETSPVEAPPVLERESEHPKEDPSTTEEKTDLNKTEETFLTTLSSMAKDSGLLYSERDLYNFHTAMKTSRLVILAGLSGTGKSSLVDLYGRALGMGSDQLHIIPVRPSWKDDADLIGYVDLIHNVYRPGDSGLIDILKKAQDDDKDKLFIICFDEMNLARVEHYFSQFLSVLEMSDKKLNIYHERLVPRLFNSGEYPSTIHLLGNVMFVGTVNIDESTHHFSDKVLDRASVIQLEMQKFGELQHRKVVSLRRSSNVISASEYQKFSIPVDSVQMKHEEFAFFEKLQEALAEAGFGIGHRIIRQIHSYLKNLPHQQDILSPRDAIDLQLVQRILTKVRGTEDQLKELVGTYNRTTKRVENSTLLTLLDESHGLSDFKETRKVILKKAKELTLNGYTA